MERYDEQELEYLLRSGAREAELREALGDVLYEKLRAAALDAPPGAETMERVRRPVFILPGIMGSKLSRRANGHDELVWIDPIDIALGGAIKLKWRPRDESIVPSGVLLSAYLEMKLRLRAAGFAPEFLPFDWRRPVADSAKRAMATLRKLGVADAVLVCHSMGGLLARAIAAEDPDGAMIARVITIGTPNFGSYSPVQVFTLEHETLQLLARIDFTRDARELAETLLRDFPGLLEILPALTKRPDENYFAASTWPNGGVVPLKTALAAAKKGQANLPAPDARFRQIIGIGEVTVQRAQRADGTLVFERSREGDGTVPRDLAEMGDVPRYYVAGSHPWLCNHDGVIAGVRDLIDGDRTDALPTHPPAVEALPLMSAGLSHTQGLAEAMARPAGDLHETDILDTLGRGGTARAGDAATAGRVAGPTLSPRGPVAFRPPPDAPHLTSVSNEERAPALDLDQAELAAQRWRDNAAKREIGRKAREEGRPLEAEEPARLAQYARRVMRHLEALPAEARADMPEQLRAALDKAEMMAAGEAPRTGPEEAMRPLVNERVIGAAEEFLSVVFIKRAALASRTVGRIIALPRLQGYGTGFLVAPGALLTNNHVLRNEVDARMSAVQFDYELDIGWRERATNVFRLDPDRLFVTDVGLDFTLVAVLPTGDGAVPLSDYGYLPLIGETGKIRATQPVNIIQHPRARRKEVVFRESTLEPLPDNPDTVLHYTGDTEPGSSGSPVCSDYWEVVALHHSGVPRTDTEGHWLTRDGQIWTRARDPEMRELDWVANEGIRVSRIVRRLNDALESMRADHPGRALLGEVLEVGRRTAQDGLFATVAAAPKIPATPPEDARPVFVAPQALDRPEHGQAGQPAITVSPALGAGSVTVSVPLTLTIAFDGVAALPVEPEPPVAPASAKLLDRKGFDRDFLGLRVEMPFPQNTIADDVIRLVGGEKIELRYLHHSVLMSQRRRLAYIAAGNYRLNAPFRAKRRDPWAFDPRIPAELQAGNEFYSDNPLDRGHLFRRADGAWGESEDEARQASDDTFYWTNIAPQHFVFNQGSRDPNLSLWGQLENLVTREAEEARGDVTVLNGPIFTADDPLHRGLAIPRAFWKIAVVRTSPTELRAFGFVVGQESLLVGLPSEFIDPGRFATFQVKVRDLETRTGLDFGSLRAADVMERGGVQERFETGTAAIRIGSPDDVLLR